MPACTVGPYAYGRVLGRDRLDALLLRRARSLGVVVLQPMRARFLGGAAGRFECEVESPDRALRTLRTPVVIDAHGSWERGPATSERSAGSPPTRKRNSDLFAFKANFRGTRLAPGFLPVLALPGAYGGMVVGDAARTTVACCIRRDRLSSARALRPGAAAGDAVEEYLRRTCRGVRDALDGASRDGPWLSVGPLRPGVRVDEFNGVFRVGNAAGESHPLIGEGISMALQSSSLLAAALLRQPAVEVSGRRAEQVNAAYSAAWRRAFVPRLRLAAVYAHVAMRPVLAGAARAWLRRWPDTLRGGARLAGKATRAADPRTVIAEIA
jgi:2-polyprenyl-6-methoxyphenol hydroxylase-like FAD-dependent oxidoreductase